MAKITIDITDKELDILSAALMLYIDDVYEAYQDDCVNKSYISKVERLKSKIDKLSKPQIDKDIDKVYEAFEIPEEESEELSNQLCGILSSMGIDIEIKEDDTE